MSKLVIATEGPCAGHLCDNCKICQRGICCRNDNPDYQLPELGEWDGPIWGDIGVLVDDGDKVQCHCCGKMFHMLFWHLLTKHNLTNDEYRAIFGLNRGQALSGPTSIGKKRSRALAFPPDRIPKMRAACPPKTPEQLHAQGIYKRRPETLINNRNGQRRYHENGGLPGGAKLTPDDIRHIREIGRDAKTDADKAEIARPYGVRMETIKTILAGRVWRNVDGAPVEKRINGHAHLTEQQAREILAANPQTFPEYRKVGSDYGVSGYVVYNIVKRKTWKWLDAA